MSESVSAEYRRGVESARQAIAVGEPYVLTIGRPNPFQGRLDVDLGVPRRSHGCVVSDESTAYVAGHNSTIEEAIDAGRLDPFLLGHKATTADAVRARLDAPGAATLTYASPRSVAAEGPYEIELAPRGTHGSETPYLFVVDGATGARRELHFLGEPQAKVAFDHAGTTLLCHDPGFDVYTTFDLRRAIALQTFRGQAR